MDRWMDVFLARWMDEQLLNRNMVDKWMDGEWIDVIWMDGSSF